jgi:hypothetical protein
LNARGDAAYQALEYFKNCSYRAIEALNKETKGYIIHEPDPDVLPYFIEGFSKVKEEILEKPKEENSSVTMNEQGPTKNEAFKEEVQLEAKQQLTDNQRKEEKLKDQDECQGMKEKESLEISKTHLLDASACITGEADRLKLNSDQLLTEYPPNSADQPMNSDESVNASNLESVQPRTPPEDPTSLLANMLSAVDPSHPLVKKDVENQSERHSLESPKQASQRPYSEDRKRNATSPPPSHRPKNKHRECKKTPETYTSLLQKYCKRNNLTPIYEKLPSIEPDWTNYKVAVGSHSFFTLKDHDSDMAAIEDVAGDAYKFFLSNQ